MKYFSILAFFFAVVAVVISGVYDQFEHAVVMSIAALVFAVLSLAHERD